MHSRADAKKRLKLVAASLLFVFFLFFALSWIEHNKKDRDIRDCEKEAFRDLCLHSRAKAFSVSDEARAWKLCFYISDYGLKNECYKDIVLSLGKANISEGLLLCGNIPAAKWRGECFFNIALDYVPISFDGAAAICEKAEVYRIFCYHDVVGAAS